MTKKQNLEKVIQQLEKSLKKYLLIIEWRQNHEAKEAKTQNRRPIPITYLEARSDFLAALLKERHPWASSAQDLLRKILPAEKKPWTVVDAWDPCRQEQPSDQVGPQRYPAPVSTEDQVKRLRTEADLKEKRLSRLCDRLQVLYLKRQIKNLRDLADHLEKVQHFSGVGLSSENFLDSKQIAVLTKATSQFERLVIRAIRNGLSHDPLISRWIINMQTLGQRDLLRRARMGFEAGASTPFCNLENEIIDLKEKGYKWEDVRKTLKAQGKPYTQSKQAFHQYLDRSGITELFRPKVQKRNTD